MQTRKALSGLTKGAASGERVDSPLDKKREEYLDVYNRIEESVYAKKGKTEMAMPFVSALRNKVAKTMAAPPDDNLPVVASYDLHAGIKRMASHSLKDAGLKRLAKQLENIWHKDPTGTLSYGQVKSLVSIYKDQFPRSAAADAIEAECTRVGLHRLPVAKLARIASKVDSQETYDLLMEENGFVGARPEQIRARAFVRGLVAANGSLDVDHGAPAPKVDRRSVVERFSSRLASIEVTADLNKTLELLSEAASTAKVLQEMLDEGANSMFVDGLEAPGQELQDLSRSLESWMGDLTKAQQAAGPDLSGQRSGPGAEEILDSGPEIEDPKQPGMSMSDFDRMQEGKTPHEDQFTETVTHGPTPEEEAGLVKKWYDPRTWSYGKTSELISMAREASLHVDDEFSDLLSSLASRLAQVLPVTNEILPGPKKPGPKVPGELDLLPEHMEMGPDDDMGQMEPLDDMSPSPDLDMPIDMSDLDMGVDVLEEVEQAADEVIQDAPPEAMDYIEHEMAEGHTAPPGTAEWGAEEILNEGHTAPPPTEGWLSEEEQEIRGQEADPRPASPGLQASKEAKRGKGIPVPGKPKHHPKVTTYAKDVKSDGGKTLKANEIEEHILAGNTVKVADFSIRINSDDEIELWHKDAGRACSIENMDVAIADFINMVDTEVATRQARRTANSFTYKVAEIVSVPCEMCGTVSVFPKAAAKDDYGCPCGHEIKNASVEEIRKVFGQSQKAYQLSIQYPVTQNPTENSTRHNRIRRALEAVHGIALNDEGKGFLVATMSNTDESGVQKMQKQLQTLGGQVEAKRWAQVAPPAPAAPAAPTAPEAPAGASPMDDMPFSDVANAAFMNYKAQGLSLMDALKAWNKEHGERAQNLTDADAAALIEAQAHNYTGGLNGMEPAAPAAAGGAPPPMPQMIATKVDAQSKMKTPSVRKPKDHVSVGKQPLGKDNAGDDLLPSPGKIKQQIKPQGKFSPKDLGKDMEHKDLIPAPKEAPRQHITPRGKFSDTDLGEDTEPNDNMKVPSPGAKPSVKK